MDTTVQNQNSVSPLSMDTTALILACHPPLKEVSTTRRKTWGTPDTHGNEYKIQVITTQTQSFQGAPSGFKDRFLSHDMFSSFVE